MAHPLGKVCRGSAVTASAATAWNAWALLAWGPRHLMRLWVAKGKWLTACRGVGAKTDVGDDYLVLSVVCVFRELRCCWLPRTCHDGGSVGVGAATPVSTGLSVSNRSTTGASKHTGVQRPPTRAHPTT